MDDEARAALDGYTPPPANLPVPLGRPSTFNTEIAKKILDHIAEGMNFSKIGALPDFPGRSTLYRWCQQNEEFAHDYAMALQWRTENRVDQMIDIATDNSEDFTPKKIGGEDGGTELVFQKESVARSTLGVETLKWVIEREMPQKYAPFEHRQPVAMPRDAFGNGDTAKEINPRAPTVIEVDPLKTQLEAAARAAKAPLPNQGQ